MKLHTLRPAAGSVRNNKRVGRGQGSGRGGTSTRGHKGAKSRSGYSQKIGFEGGQMPLYRRVPKFGFKNPFRVEYTPVNLDTLQKIAEAKGITAFTQEELVNLGLVNKNDKIKVLGRGELKASLEVSAHAFSASAKAAIEQAGGKANTL
ncbi:50S ribosomal protein L15 [Algivirga pacifica]|uniref:Large ribosomal subunit protein uL15 n=1 Tax=Algivirga pacifica TaxID=1162670 RepID=A0ABP9DJL7_9BACT